MGTRLAVAAIVLLLAATGCSFGTGDDADPSLSPSSPASPSATATSPASGAASSPAYVALGDSFTAGPGIGDEQPDAGFCQRSTRNWPSLVAASAGVEVTDVSCVGATTTDLAGTVASGVLGSGPRLVTVSTGGNDGALFSSLITACAGGGDSCSAFVTERAPDILARTTDDIAALLAQVRTAAPDAKLLLVGYPRIAPETGGCDVIGIPDASSVLAAETALDDSLAEAAGRADVPYVSLRAASRNHDACSGADAWTNGISAAPGDGITFHPTARGMAGVAEVVTKAADLS
jgi:lysophospholipase L1-like esterase